MKLISSFYTDTYKMLQTHANHSKGNGGCVTTCSRLLKDSSWCLCVQVQLNNTRKWYQIIYDYSKWFHLNQQAANELLKIVLYTTLKFNYDNKSMHAVQHFGFIYC